MAPVKVRRVDFSADEWLAGTFELSDQDRGVYITICALIWSRGGRIPEGLLRQHCSSHGNAISASLGRLEKAGKIVRNGLEIGQKRAENELETSEKRVRNASENGSKGNKIRWGNDRDPMSPPIANHQLPTTNYQLPEKNLSPESSQTPSPARPKKSTPAKLAFEGRVIRLKQSDFDRWQTTFGSIPDLAAELEAIDGKFAAKIAGGEVGLSKNWFATASAWLRTSHERRLTQAPPPPDLRPDIAETDRHPHDFGDAYSRPTLGQWRRRFAHVKAGNEWNWDWGAPPGPGCACPPGLAEEYGVPIEIDPRQPRLRSVT